MKALKLLVVAVLFTISYGASAQTYKDVEAKASITSAQITEGLDLTGDQQMLIFRQVMTIEDTKNRMEARGDNDASVAEAYQSRYQAFLASVEKLMTAEQFASKKDLIADLYAPTALKATETK